MKKPDNEDIEENIEEKENDLTEENSSSEDEVSVDDSSDDEPEDKPAKKAAPAANKQGSNKKAIIIEIALAAVAVIVIIVAIVLRQKQNADSSGNQNGDISISTGQDGSELAAIDNSILFSTTPDVPAMVQNESLDYEALVADNKMLKLKGSEGQDVYVHNYLNSEYFNEETKFDESQVDDLIAKNVLINYLEPVAVTRDTAEMYDTVSINFAGSMDGVAFAGGTANDQELTIGVSAFIDGFTEGIVGMKVGETKDVHVTFPEEYPNNPDLAGKPAVFAITLNKIITGNKIPTLTDEMASTYTGGEITTAKELKDYFRKNQLSLVIWDFIDTDFYLSSLSDDAILSYYKKIIDQIDASSQQYQMSAEKLVSMYYGIDIESYKSEMMTEAVESMRHSILYNAIAEKEGITVSEDDIAELAANYGYEGNVDGFKSDYGEDVIHDFILQDNLMTYFLTLHK